MSYNPAKGKAKKNICSEAWGKGEVMRIIEMARKVTSLAFSNGHKQSDRPLFYV